MERPGFMADAHDLPLIRPGADDEIGILESLALNDEAVITRRLERIRHTLENALVVMVDQRRFAMHDTDVAHHLAAEGLADALMPQTDAQDRRCLGEPFEHFVGDAGLIRRAGARR